MRGGRAARPAIASFVAALCLVSGGCGILHGAGFSDESKDNDCSPPKGVQTVEEYSNQTCSRNQKPLPQPSIDQLNEIISKIQKFGPKPVFDVSRVATATFSVCVSLIGNAKPSEIAPPAEEWFSHKGNSLSLAQARSVVDLVVAQGWCVEAR